MVMAFLTLSGSTTIFPIGGKNMTKIGDKIKIIQMEGEPKYEGREGAVKYIDDLGQLHGTWGGCALIPGTDQFELVQRGDSI